MGRIISMEFTINLGHKGFNKELIDHAITMFEEVNAIMSQFSNTKLSDVVDAYHDNSSWFSLQRQLAH